MWPLHGPIHEGREVPSRRLEGRQERLDGILSGQRRTGIRPDRLPELGQIQRNGLHFPGARGRYEELDSVR